VANDQRRTTNGFAIIGKPTAMVDAAGKTTGAGKYTDDLSLPGMLIGRILHSPYPHARIKSMDTHRAEKLEGVVAVVTGKDAPNPYGILPVGHDEYALALDKVRYVGDNVACVAAVDEATADQALELIDVEYELLPAYFDPEESMKALTDLIHDNKPHNLEKDYHHVFGDPEKVLPRPITWLKPASSLTKSHMPPWNPTARLLHSKSTRIRATADG
jgi:4-hydroxybenzoyl-CoA reductase subunit alpha